MARRRKGITVTVVRDPGATHSLRYFRANLPLPLSGLASIFFTHLTSGSISTGPHVPAAH